MKLRFVILFVLALLCATPSVCVLPIMFEVEENTAANELIGTVDFTDGEISSFTPACQSYVNISGNELRTVVQLDREEVVRNTGEDILTCSATLPDLIQQFQIKILDVNDNVPRFSELERVHMLNVTENFNIPNPIQRLQTVDDDKGENGTVEFSITAGNEENFFFIDEQLEYEGPDDRKMLFFNHSVDYELYQNFNLTITVHDHGIPPLCFEQIVFIKIIDVNDEGPTFIATTYSFEVLESHPLGSQNPFGNVSAVDPDSGPSVSVYTALSDPHPDNAFNYIALNNETGELYLEQSIDFETDTTLRHIFFWIEVKEQGRTVEDITRVDITILDANDDKPQIDIIRSPDTILENRAVEKTIVLQVTDVDGIGQYSAQVQPPINITVTYLSFLKAYKLRINDILDREKVENITINFTVNDLGNPPLGATVTLVLVVLDENDNSPNFSQITYDAVVGENAPLQKIATTVEATDPDLAENGSVSYSITYVTPSLAQQWFDLNPLTGDIRVKAPLNYSIAERVSITVTASDNGTAPSNISSHRSTSTTVNISISPAVTFKPRSFQEHCNPAIKIQDTSKIYIEFQTSEKNGLLLYEETAQDEVLVLGIENGKLIAIAHNVQSIFETFDVSTDNWISVLYDSELKTLDVWHTEHEEGETERENILRASEIVRCDSTYSNGQTFFVGGIDLFSDYHNASWNNDFVGIIRNLVIDSVQVDLASPIREENTARGILFPSEPKCGELEMTCSGPHYTGCLDYDMESHCICAGGFNTDTCKEEENYAPIQLASSSMVKLELVDYSLFYDLERRSALVSTGARSRHSGLVSTDARSRKRRSLTDTAGYQLVEFQFRLLRNSTGTLLYSQTDSSIHTLQINKQPTEYTMVYTISNLELSYQPVHMTEILRYELGKLYIVVINITTTDVSVSFNGTTETSPLNTIEPFIKYPKTLISLGGAVNPRMATTSNFTGCIARLAVNGIEFPLNGLVESNDPSIQISGGDDSGVSTTCDLCTQETYPCPGTSSCVNHIDHYECECPVGQVLDEDQCIDAPITEPSATPRMEPLNPSETATNLTYYIIGCSVGGTFIAIVVVLFFACLVCCKRYQRRSKKQTYHVGGGQQLPQLGNGERSRPNSYSNVTCRPSSCNSEPGYITVSQHNHESSNEHDIDEDNESNTQNMTRSKSSTSGETGFHTASERDERSIPRMEDSGNEKETEYSPFESSDDETQSYIDVHSTANMRHNVRGLTLPRFPTPSESSGPVSGLGAPLTPKEKKFITPVRPDSRSELEEETDLDTDFSSTVLAQTNFRRAYRGGSLKLQGRSGSGMSGHQWYKSSTSSDTEREKKRAEGNHAYYPPSQFHSFRLPRATSVSPPQCVAVSRVMRKSSSPINPPRLQTSRPKGITHTISPPRSPLTSYNHHTMPSHSHQKERDTSEISEFSTQAVLSRSQPLKMHHPFFRQSSTDSPRVPPHLATRSYIPPYIRSFSEESTCKGEKKFVDLGSVRTNCDPIQYWEGQTRMMATVDQVDAYPVLSESFTAFDDSAAESQQSGPEHRSFSSQGGGEGTAEALDVGLLQLHVRDRETDSVTTGTTLKGSEAESKVMLFPSADCSEEYRCTPQILSTVGTCSIPPSQGTFEV